MADAYRSSPRTPTGSDASFGWRRERFLETLERGLKLFEEIGSDEPISGEQAFTLAATYGFPLELTVELAEERGQAVDVDGYHIEMDRHRDVSRAGGSGELQRAADFARAADFTTDFVGYTKTDVITQIGALEAVDDDHFLASCASRRSIRPAAVR
jgi:alanyl-tRNA synthetase